MTGSAALPTADRQLQDRDGAWVLLYADTLRSWLAEGGSVCLPLAGSSMRPAIESGARIVVGACDPGTIRIGDVVLYEDGERLICHRVLGRDGGRMLTAGDGVRLPPAWVPASAVVGRVIAIDAGGRRRPLDDRSERIRALAAAARTWAGVLGRRFVRARGRAATRTRTA